ncbi:MAG: hypothetical protein ABI837_18235 [Acidobacteriota bacterium]
MRARREPTNDQDEAGAQRREQVLRDPDILARAEAALEAFRRRETPDVPGVGPEELPDFLREHNR